MFKNQLQELAQRSCFNLPSYSCIREGPDHAPRFKATVNFNGETFESPNYCATLRQAEHAAAEVALSTLSRRGPSQSLAAKILDETSVCKNLLQETAQRAGVSLPVYTTIRGGPGHLPVFKCIVEVAGRVFAGEPAKTKKQAEKNAAMAAWSAIKQLNQAPMITDGEEGTSEEGTKSGALTLYKRDDRSQNSSRQQQPPQRSYGGRPRVRMVNVRDRNRLTREGSPGSGQFSFGGSSKPSPSGDSSYEPGRFLFNQQTLKNSDSMRSNANSHQRSHSLTGIDSSVHPPNEGIPAARPGGYLSRMLPRPRHHQPQAQQHQPQRLSRMSLQSCSDRFELRRPMLMEELQLIQREDDDWLSGLDNNSIGNHVPQQSVQTGVSPDPRMQRRPMFQSQSERFELKPSLLDELYQRDEEDWWMRGEIVQPVSMLDREKSPNIYGDHEKSSFTYYDSNTGSFSTASDSSPYGASYSNEHSSIHNSYGSGYIEQQSKAGYSNYNDSIVQKGNTYVGYGEGLKMQSMQSPYGNFNEAPNSSPYARSSDSGPTYSNYNVDHGKGSFFSGRAPKNPFSSFGKSSSGNSSSINEDHGGSSSSSSSIWSRPAQWWSSHLHSNSNPSTPLAAAQSVGLRPASSIAPPVRVRQMVAVCSAPPPRRPSAGGGGDGGTAASSSSNTHSFQQHCSMVLSGSSAAEMEASTRQLFDQLRL